ncbi:uncharacterized protein [Polyergus mexicanus]|uniref:uncharacterized protein n=1 Tax=Polyergus mexicanus TaxID=615972 RepID=UPI0038B58352
MAEAQKICDREVRGIRSSNCYFNRINKDKIDRIKRAEDIIQDLECHGPAGLIHISVLSNIIGKPIQIWNPNGSLNRIIGNGKTGRPIDIEYHTTDSEQIALRAIKTFENQYFTLVCNPIHNFHPIHFLNPSLGHWTLKYGKDPDNISIDLNSCLFSVIGSQIGRDPSELRKWTVLKLKSKFRKLVNLINKILRLEKNGEIILMIGGARYCGTSPKHARIILDNSQDHKCHGFSNPGHPRGHAYHPSGFSIVHYSLNSVKTGFPTRADQDYVTHLALRTEQAQNAMTVLNKGRDTITIHVTPNELGNSGNLPRVIKYTNGIEETTGDMRDVVLVLRHHEGQFENPDADVFVQTCYPRLA